MHVMHLEFNHYLSDGYCVGHLIGGYMLWIAALLNYRVLVRPYLNIAA